MGTRTLTLSQKAKWTPLILERDFPDGQTPHCFYCQQEFIKKDSHYAQEWEHLNNDESDNRPENLVWAHAKCNELKKKNPEWQVLAQEKLRKNIRYHSESLGEGASERPKRTHTERQPNEQIDANADGMQESEKYLTERLLPTITGNPPPETQLDWNKTEDAIAYLCYKKYGHGSQKTIRYYLKMLTSDHAPFDTKDDGRYIVRRKGQ